MKLLKNNILLVVSFIVLVFAFLWHFTSVKEAAAITGTGFLIKVYGLSALLGSTSLVVFYFFLFKIKSNLYFAIFSGISIFTFALLYTFLFPPLSAPDEVSHYISAYKVSNIMLMKQPVNEKGYVLIRARDLYIEDTKGKALIIENEDKGLKYIQKDDKSDTTLLGQELNFDTYKDAYGTAKDSDKYVAYKGAELARTSFIHVNTSNLIYIPQALGISLARLSGMDSISLLFMGRIFNAAFFALILAFTVYVAPYFKKVFSALALLPMSLHLAGSFSYDALIISLIFLYIAYVLKLREQKENVRVRDIALLAALVTVFGPCKIVYAPVVAFGLVVPVKKFGNLKNYILSILFIGASLLIAMYVVNYSIINTYVTESSALLPYEDVPKYTLSYLLTRPREFISLFYLTVLNELEFYHVSMFGAYLGNIDANTEMPYIFVFVFTIFLILLSCKYKGEEDTFLNKTAILYSLFLFIIIFGLILFSMLIAWTPMTSRWILGVQGRYFIPVITLLLFGIKKSGIELKRDVSNEILYIMLSSNLYILLYVFSVVINRF